MFNAIRLHSVLNSSVIEDDQQVTRDMEYEIMILILCCT